MKSLFEALISAKAALLLILVYLLKKNCNAKIIVSNYDIPNKPSHCKFLFEGELGSLAFHENTN